MYCPECGHRMSSEDFRFCPECGTRLPSCPSHGPSAAKGIILTNLKLLSRKFGQDEEHIRHIIGDYISEKRMYGVSYTLADAGCYRFRSGWRTAHLGNGSTPEEHLKILADICSRPEDGKLPEYLFIIGGSDIIPMPRIRHYLGEGSSDESIDTDLLYSYPYGDVSSRMIESREIFRKKAVLLAGRLPLAKDAVCGDLIGYLERSLKCSAGIMAATAYGQCDPHWKKVSAEVAGRLIRCGALPDLDGKLPDEIYYNRLMVSPMIHIGNVTQVFDTEASLYYFNLHGGEGRQLNCYFGELPDDIGEDTLPVIGPEHLRMCKTHNIVVSEACYGAKFIGLDKSESMMLSALASNAAVFVGSSRIAWGSCDKSDGEEELFAADILAKTFMESILDGYDTGEAFFKARKEVLSSHGAADLYAALTVTEFNLFGDPSLSFSSREMKSKGNTDILAEDIGYRPVSVRLVSEESERQGILDTVRQAVDSNINAIHEAIAAHLYSSYGITPRKPSRILRVSGTGKEDEMIYVYNISKGKCNIDIAVTASASGNVKKVYMSK